MAETSSGDRLKQPYSLQNKLDILGQFRAFERKPQDLVGLDEGEGDRLGRRSPPWGSGLRHPGQHGVRQG